MSTFFSQNSFFTLIYSKREINDVFASKLKKNFSSPRLHCDCYCAILQYFLVVCLEIKTFFFRSEWTFGLQRLWSRSTTPAVGSRPVCTPGAGRWASPKRETTSGKPLLQACIYEESLKIVLVKFRATEEQLKVMPKAELDAKVEAARKKLYQSGAHYVIDTISDLPEVVDHINERLAMGLSP